jgi:hypothetical protein
MFHAEPAIYFTREEYRLFLAVIWPGRDFSFVVMKKGNSALENPPRVVFARVAQVRITMGMENVRANADPEC